MQSEEQDLLIVTEEEAGERLDKLLAKRFQDVYSRAYFQRLIDDHLVLLNGMAVKKRVKPESGDEIEVEFAALPEAQLLPEAIPLSIIYEDENLLAINKPAGMVVHPAPGHWSGTFVHALLYHCQGQGQGLEQEKEKANLRPGIVHRLDKETSGLLVAAKTLDMQQKLTALFASRQVYKEYWAICVGHPPPGEIQAPIGRHPIHRKQMAVVPSGRPAVSMCKILRSNDKLSLVQVVITTGRTHQIRVHLKYKGTPVLGDALYGIPSFNHAYGVERQLLHARILAFDHPLSGKRLELEAPLPEDFLRVMKKIS